MALGRVLQNWWLGKVGEKPPRLRDHVYANLLWGSSLGLHMPAGLVEWVLFTLYTYTQIITEILF